MNRIINNNINIKNDNFNKIKKYNLNFGPQHPAAHGVLRLILGLDGEIINNIDIHIGFLHRGSEKLMESRYYLKSLPYFDRFDYVSMMTQEHAYCLVIESILKKHNYSSVFNYVRSMFDELTRILNHFLAISCHALDVGSMTPVFWAFEERENIMEFYERVSGARMHAAFYRPNKTNFNIINKALLNDILLFSKKCINTINEIHNILSYNKIWKQRLKNIGILNSNLCRQYSLTGVMARSTGIKRDIRFSKIETYANYYYLNFRSFTGNSGDSFDRYLIRMYEMVESLNLINQNVNFLKKKLKLKKKKKKNPYNSMENLISHFKYWSENIYLEKNFSFKTIESPKGEFSVSLFSDGTNRPYRCKVRSPAYFNLQALPILAKGNLLADLVTLLGTIDIVFGEIDR